MKKLKQIFGIIFTIISIAMLPSCKSAGTDANGTVDLKMNFKEGDKYLYTTVNENIGAVQGYTMTNTMTMEMIYTCSGDSAGNKTLDITYDHILMELNSPMGDMKYDSKNHTTNDGIPLSIMDSLIGKSFAISVGTDGRIISVSGLDKIIRSFDIENDQAMQTNVKNQLGDTAIRLMMQNSFDMYPGHPVKIGDTWNKKAHMSFSGISVDADNDYTLKSIEDGKATIALNAKLVPAETKVGADSTGIHGVLNGKQEGNIEMDIATGQVINSQISSDVKGKMMVMGVEREINLKSKVHVTSNVINLRD